MDEPLGLRFGEIVASEADAEEIAAAYVAGYADGAVLLHTNGHDHTSIETLECVRARYLRYTKLESPAPAARAYIAGVRDVAADNLPCPPHEIRSQIHHVAA